MAPLRNPHPGEILKEEFLSAIGMSQNLSSLIASVCRAIASTPSLMAPAILRAIPICAYANFSVCLKVIFCGSRTPMTHWKPSAALQSRWPRSSPTSRVKRPRQGSRCNAVRHGLTAETVIVGWDLHSHPQKTWQLQRS